MVFHSPSCYLVRTTQQGCLIILCTVSKYSRIINTLHLFRDNTLASPGSKRSEQHYFILFSRVEERNEKQEHTQKQEHARSLPFRDP
jgi:hypothetical protein